MKRLIKSIIWNIRNFDFDEDFKYTLAIIISIIAMVIDLLIIFGRK